MLSPETGAAPTLGVAAAPSSSPPAAVTLLLDELLGLLLDMCIYRKVGSTVGRAKWTSRANVPQPFHILQYA